jgi:hypothetical protein
MDGCVLVKHRCRHTINEIARREKRLIPKPQRQRGMSEKSKTSLDQVTVFALGNPVLLRSMRIRNALRNTSALKVAMQLMILTTPIRLDSLDLGIQETLDMSLEGVKHLFNIRLVFQKINPTKT